MSLAGQVEHFPEDLLFLAESCGGRDDAGVREKQQLVSSMASQDGACPPLPLCLLLVSHLSFFFARPLEPCISSACLPKSSETGFFDSLLVITF